MVPLLLNVLACEWLYLPPPVTEISGFLLSNFIMIVVIFGFFDLTLDLVPPNCVILRVLSMSEKCRLSLRMQDFSFLEIQGQSAGCFLTIFRGRKESIAEVSSIINSLNLSSQDSVLRMEYQSFLVIQHPSAHHALSCISRDYFLKDQFVFRWYHWSGQDDIMIRWCDFGQLWYTEQLWSICKKPVQHAWVSSFESYKLLKMVGLRDAFWL